MERERVARRERNGEKKGGGGEREMVRRKGVVEREKSWEERGRWRERNRGKKGGGGEKKWWEEGGGGEKEMATPIDHAHIAGAVPMATDLDGRDSVTCALESGATKARPVTQGRGRKKRSPSQSGAPRYRNNRELDASWKDTLSATLKNTPGFQKHIDWVVPLAPVRVREAPPHPYTPIERVHNLAFKARGSTVFESQFLRKEVKILSLKERILEELAQVSQFLNQKIMATMGSSPNYQLKKEIGQLKQTAIDWYCCAGHSGGGNQGVSDPSLSVVLDHHESDSLDDSTIEEC
uniref:Uncharacterized protein n=1 Tax=Timema douglasi TaxID=61478 RepID=A0A7R8VN55_TIMDO|nr:unnamed protein product [Timema douglasi]